MTRELFPPHGLGHDTVGNVLFLLLLLWRKFWDGAFDFVAAIFSFGRLWRGRL